MKKLLTIIALFFLAGCTSKTPTLENKQEWVNDFIKQANHLQDQSVLITTTTMYDKEKSVVEDYYYVEDAKDYLQIARAYDENDQLSSLKLMIHDPTENKINMYQGFMETKIELFKSIESTENYLTCHEFNLEDVEIDYDACTKDKNQTTISFSKTQNDSQDPAKTITNYFVIEATSKNDQLIAVNTYYYAGSKDQLSAKTEKTISYELPDHHVLQQKLNQCIEENPTKANSILES